MEGSGDSTQRTWTHRYMKARQMVEKKSMDGPYSSEEHLMAAQRCVRREALSLGISPGNEGEVLAAAIVLLEEKRRAVKQQYTWRGEQNAWRDHPLPRT